MEMGSRIRWIVILVILIVFVGLVAWGLFSIASNLFNRTSNNNDDTQSAAVLDDTELTLLSAGEATFEVDGPVVANEEHRSYVITITSAESKIQLFERYGARVIEEQNYPNTQDSFDAFMAALANENITALSEGATEELAFAEQGVCARGKRYIVEIDSDIRRWTTSCSSREGNAGFSMSRVRSLFQRQIPDFRDVVRGTGL